MPCTGDDFSHFAFIATGAPDPAGRRTMGDRLSDIVNVKDWGAKGDGSFDDTSAIQTAIQFCITRAENAISAGAASSGGIVFFPQGSYKINQPLTAGSNVSANIGIIIRGSGKNGTYFSGASGGYSDPHNYGFDLSGGAGVWTNDCLESVQSITGLAIRVTRAGASVINCNMGGRIAIDASAAIGAYIADCLVQSNSVNASSTTYGIFRGTNPGTIGIAITTGAIVGCRVQFGYEVAYALGGSGSACLGSSTEVIGVAVRVGWGVVSGVPGHVPSSGAVIQGLQTERCAISIDLYDAAGCYVSGNILTGTTSPAQQETITGFTWAATAGGTATAATLVNHNLPVGNSNIQIANAGGWVPPNTLNAVGATVATRVDNTHFSYPLAVNPGASQTGLWTFNCLSGIRAVTATECIITGNQIVTQAEIGGIDLSGATSNISNICYGNQVDHGWMMPTDAHNLASWKFSVSEAFNTINGGLNNYNGGVISPNAHMVFVNLPGQAGVFQHGPFEGQEYDIIDGSKFGFTPPTAALWNDQVIGGGNGHYKVRYNGTAWFRIG